MQNQPENTRASEPVSSETSKKEKETLLKRLADKAATKARETERRYDQQHGTFPRGGPSGMA